MKVTDKQRVVLEMLATGGDVPGGGLNDLRFSGRSIHLDGKRLDVRGVVWRALERKGLVVAQYDSLCLPAWVITEKGRDVVSSLNASPTPLKCEAKTMLCRGDLVRTYGVNRSEKEGKTFAICGVCAVMIKRGGSKLVDV